MKPGAIACFLFVGALQGCAATLVKALGGGWSATEISADNR